MAKKSRFFPTAPEKMVKNKKYFGFFLVSYISIQKKKCTSEHFLQGRPMVGDCINIMRMTFLFKI